MNAVGYLQGYAISPLFYHYEPLDISCLCYDEDIHHMVQFSLLDVVGLFLSNGVPEKTAIFHGRRVICVGETEGEIGTFMRKSLQSNCWFVSKRNW